MHERKYFLSQRRKDRKGFSWRESLLKFDSHSKDVDYSGILVRPDLILIWQDTKTEWFLKKYVIETQAIVLEYT